MQKIRRATLRRKKPKEVVEDEEESVAQELDTQVMSSTLQLVPHNTLKREGKADQHLFKLLNEKRESSRSLATTRSTTSSRWRRRRKKNDQEEDDDDDETASQERVYGTRRSTLKELGEEDETFLVRLANSTSALNKFTGQVGNSFKMAMSKVFSQQEKPDDDKFDAMDAEYDDDDDLIKYEDEDEDDER